MYLWFIIKVEQKNYKKKSVDTWKIGYAILTENIWHYMTRSLYNKDFSFEKDGKVLQNDNTFQHYKLLWILKRKKESYPT